LEKLIISYFKYDSKHDVVCLSFFSQTLKDVYSNARGNKSCNYNQRLKTHFGKSSAT
jgi:hypothetical protein